MYINVYDKMNSMIRLESHPQNISFCIANVSISEKNPKPERLLFPSILDTDA